MAPFSGHPIAAAHAVADPTSYLDPSQGGGIDREGTLTFRHHLLGLERRPSNLQRTRQP